MTNIVTEVRSVAADYPDEVALSVEKREATYGELWEEIGQFAAGLADQGIEKGDRVAVYLPNVPQFVTAFHGTLRAGGVVVPMNPQYKAREIRYLLADSGARVVVTLSDLTPFVTEVRDETDLEHVVTVGGDAETGTKFETFLGGKVGGPVEGDEIPVADCDSDDVAVQPYTSGTTGRPKGVQLTHRNLSSNAATAADLVPDGIGPGDRQLGVLPLFHIYGMTVVMNATLFNGGAYYPLPQWDAQEAVSLIEEEELTLMHGVPAMYNDVINQPNAADFDLSSLRMAGVGGSGIPIEVLRRFEELYDVTVYEGYGLTETSPVTHFNSPDVGRRVGSIGKALPGIDAKIVDGNFEERPRVERGPVDEEEVDLDDVTGELVVAGPNVMRGYADLPDANEEAFTEVEGKRWFHTDDIGYWDEDEFFYIVDRMKHMINTAGYNVYPREVEELLFEHESVADVAVVGIPDERRGETVKAFIVPVADAEVTPGELKQFCLDNLAEYKHPREVEFVEALPRTTTGKVQKFELREREREKTAK